MSARAIVSLVGERDGKVYADTVTLSEPQWEALLQPIRARIAELEARPGHISGSRTMAEYNRLVSLITTIDI